MTRVPPSFDPDGSVVVAAADGQLVHRDTLEHVSRLQLRLFTVRPGVWCLIGNGLSNQTFIDAPDGIIAIDTGESIEEMTDALAHLRTVTDRPIAAVVYSHFHYVGGTAAIGHEVPVYGHHRIAANRARAGGAIGPGYGRGLVYQFGTSLPPDGPDGLFGVGLGLYYRNPAHAPFTTGHVPVTHPLNGGEEIEIAGLPVQVAFTPSDSDDSITLWFPTLGVCVHNNLWPALFNVFAIRGEEYRDPRILVDGLDHILSLGAEHLVATHGPPLSGRDEIVRRTTGSRDAIQFLWDQTVRGINLGWTDDEIADRVRLPAHTADDWYTREFYGVAEHHVRQIAVGVRGWFDGDPGKLFRVEPHERARRLVEGFGGAEVVLAQIHAAIAENDLRWALELASWLRTVDPDEASFRLVTADVLRRIGQRTTAANIRNWCLTAARDLDGTRPQDRHRMHRLRPQQVAGLAPLETVRILSVMLDPARAVGVDAHVAWVVDGTTPVGSHVRNGILCATDGHGAHTTVELSLQRWVDLVCGTNSWDDTVATGEVQVDGDPAAVARVLACIDLTGTAG